MAPERTHFSAVATAQGPVTEQPSLLLCTPPCSGCPPPLPHIAEVKQVQVCGGSSGGSSSRWSDSVHPPTRRLGGGGSRSGRDRTPAVAARPPPPRARHPRRTRP